MFRKATAALGSAVARRVTSASPCVSRLYTAPAAGVTDGSHGFVRSYSAGWISRCQTLLKEAAKLEDGPLQEYEHATGLEREEIAAQLQGTTRFETAPPRGPFGTKEAPAVVESVFDERIVGCSGGYAEEEHDVVWFKLKKGVPHDCVVCGQVFELKVVGEGGLPGAHH